MGTVTAQYTDANGQTSSTIPPRGIGLADLIVDTSDLGPGPGEASKAYRVYVVVDPDNKFPKQTHGWHVPQTTLIFGPASNISPE